MSTPNVLILNVTEDNPDQLADAVEAIEGSGARGERLYVSVIVLCELAWVLQCRRYGSRRDELVRVFRYLLEIPLFEIQHRNAVHLAVEDFASGPADFADYLIGRLSDAAGCEGILTFDSRLSESQVFTGLREA